MMTRELLASLRLDIYSIERVLCGKWWRYSNVCNPYNRLYLVVGGEAYVTHHDRRYHLKQNCLHLIPCLTRVDMECPESFDVYYLHFTSRTTSQFDLFSVLECDYQVRSTPLEQERFERLLQLNPDVELKDYDPYRPAEETRKHFADSSVTGQAVSNCIETEALIRMLLSPILRTAREISPSRVGEIEFLQVALAWIEDHLRDPIELADLAARVHMHPTYFSDRFQRVIGIRPIAYVNQRRIDLAKTLLESTSRSVKQIAIGSGFRNSSYFCRVFKKQTGLSPKAYREERHR